MREKATTALPERDSLTLTSFEPYDLQHNNSSEQSVITKLFTKVKTAVTGPNSQPLDIDNADQESPNFAEHLSLNTAPPPSPLPLYSDGKSSSEKSNDLQKYQRRHTIQVPSTEPIDTLNNQLNEEPPSNRPSLEQVANNDAYDSDDAQSVMTTFSVSNYNSLNRIIGRLRGVQAVPQLNVEYWMPDSQVNECRDCNAPFKFYRRKHHCRVCGQIFCAKCTSDIVDGETLGHFGKVRVCKFCYSNLQPTAMHEKPTVAGALVQERSDITSNDDACTSVGTPLHATRPQTPRLHFSTPTARNSFDDDYMIHNIRRSSGEFDGQPPIPSPSLSTYQREDQDSGHKKGFLPKRPRSRTITMNSLVMDTMPLSPDVVRPSMKPTLPFRRNSLNGFTVDGGGLPLGGIAPLTDTKENSTAWKWEKVPQSLSSLIESKNSAHVEKQNDENVKDETNHQPKSKNSNRFEDGGALGSADDVKRRHSLINSANRPARKRTYSLMKNASLAALDTMTMTMAQKSDSEKTANGYRRHRRQSSTCSGMELDLMSMDYMRKMLRQMLQECPSEVKDRIDEWESIVMKLLLKVVDRVRQDVRGGDEIDIRHYVKIKKIAGGSPNDSFYVQGVVCTKNVAHKQMVRKIQNPRILIIKFPLEWSRDYQGDQQLQSIKRVMEQEKDFLEKLVNRIIALKPSVLLVHSNVSRFALDFLVKNDIVVAYNVKPSILDAVARCSGATIISSLADLNNDESVLGLCGVFEPKTILHDLLPNRRKTFLIFRDCPADLGATIILRGGSVDALQAVKKVLDFMVFVVHNLRLETIFHKDLAKTQSSCVTQRESNKDVTDEQTVCSILPEKDGTTQEGLVAIREVIRRYQNALLSASPRVMIPLPHLLSRLCETEKNLVHVLKDHGLKFSNVCSKEASVPSELSQMPDYFQAFEQELANESEYARLLEEHHHRWRAFETYVGSDAEELNPSYHQQLVVLYATVCCETAVPCHDPELRMFEYYRPDSDVTLGQYVEDVSTYSDMICTSVMCERTMMEHYRTYAHGNAQICVSLERIEAPPAIMNANAVLMWSYCKQCDADSILVPLSEEGWKYSFGKFLEVVFHHQSSSPAKDAWCPHSVYRDHILYFAYKGIAVKFEYTPIVPYDIRVPATRLHIDPSVQVSIKDAASDSLRSKIVQFYESIIERNKSFQLDTVLHSKREHCKLHLQDLSHRANSEKKQMLQFLQNVYATTPPTDTLSLNIVRIKVQMHVLQWKLVYAQFVRQYVVQQPSRRKKNQQLDNVPMETTDLDARTKRLTNSADLPLLDVGIDGYDEFFCGESQSDSGNNNFSTMPVLGTSPSTSSQIIRGPETSNHDNDPNIQNRIEEESSSSDTDSSSTEEEDARAAQRLSLELLQKKSKHATWSMSRLPRPHDIERREGRQPQQQQQQQQQQHQQPHNDVYRRRKRVSYPAGAKTERMPLPMSSRDYKRLADLLPSLDSEDISKSRSSPPLVSRLLHSYQSGQPASNSNEIRSKLSSLESQVSKSNQQHQQQKQTTRKQPPKDRKASAEHKTRIPVRNGRPLKHQRDQNLQAVADGQSSKPGAKDNHQKIRFASKEENQENGVRRVRQRLPSKASIEVYTTLRELVREDSEDEFMASESDLSSSDEEEEQKDEVTQEQQQQQQQDDTFFSMMDMDEYDESLGRELSPKLRRHHSDILQRVPDTSKALPHLDFDGYNDLEQRRTSSHESTSPSEQGVVAAKDSQNLTVSDFRSFAEKNGLTKDSNPFETIASAFDLSFEHLDQPTISKMATSILSEKGLESLKPLKYPLSPLEHVFPGSPIVVGEDEPSTIIAYSLSCDVYLRLLNRIRKGDQTEEAKPMDEEDEGAVGDEKGSLSDDGDPTMGQFIERTLNSKSGIHVKYHFTDGTTKFFCKIYFVEQFDALRRNCGCEASYIASLASCAKWDSSGGKSGSVFLKTKDDRLLIKQISRYEMDAFLRFAPSYFQYLSEAFFHELPTVLCKIFGLYRIGFKNTTTGKSMRMDILVMENLFYQRNVKRIFDLKGSMRNRHVQATGRDNEVLLDENMVELILQSPLFLHSYAKEMLRGSLHNDTLFLSRMDVMDYSLLVGVDENNHELIVGIIDFMRTFTWDKKLESWVKESGLLGGGGKEPTIISPKQYRVRFREAMERYFLMVPDFWTAKLMRQRYHHEVYPVEHGETDTP